MLEWITRVLSKEWPAIGLVIGSLVCGILLSERLRMAPLKDEIAYLKGRLEEERFETVLDRYKIRTDRLREEVELLEHERETIIANIDSLRTELDFFIKLVEAWKAGMEALGEFLGDPERALAVGDTTVPEEIRNKAVLDFTEAIQESIRLRTGMPVDSLMRMVIRKFGVQEVLERKRSEFTRFKQALDDHRQTAGVEGSGKVGQPEARQGSSPQ